MQFSPCQLLIAVEDGVVLNTAYILLVLGGAGGVITALFRLLISSKDREFALLTVQKDKALADLESVKKSYQEIATEALKSATETANYYRAKEGKAPIIPVAPVITESHSPSNVEQRETGLIATQRAKLAQVKLAMNQEPRLEPPRKQDAKKDEPVLLTVPDLVSAPSDFKRTTVDAIRALESMEDAIEAVPKKTSDLVVEKLAKPSQSPQQKPS